MSALSSRLFFLPFLFVTFFCLTACQPTLHTREAYVFGTLVQITVANAKNPNEAISAVLRDYNELYQRLHPWQESELSSLNAAIRKGKTDIPISSELSEIILDAKQYAALTKHKFNPAIGALIENWGFHHDEYSPHVPSKKTIAALIASNPTMDDITIEKNILHCKNLSVQIDLGGYAKGLALDKAAKILKDHGVNNALINIGGNILALGQKGDTPWRVAIRHPRRSGVFAVLELSDYEAIGTSGDYQRYYEADGNRYHHIIDPSTGYPASKVASVTIITQGENSGRRSDVFSKPFFIDGITAAANHSKNTGIKSVLFTDLNGQHWLSPKMMQKVQFLSGNSPSGILNNF